MSSTKPAPHAWRSGGLAVPHLLGGFLVATGLVLLVASHARADGIERLPPSTEALDLEAALAEADASPSVIAARAAERRGEGETALAGTFPGPSFTVDSQTVSARLDLGVSVPFPAPGLRRARTAAARSAENELLALRLGATRIARHALRTAWSELWAAQEGATLSAERATRAESTGATLRALFEAGRVPRLDAVQAAAEAGLARSETLAREEDRRAASDELALLLGRDRTRPIEAAGPAPDPPATRSEALSLVLTEAGTPALAAAEARARTAELGIDVARAEGRPEFSLEAGAAFADPTDARTDARIGFAVAFQSGPSARVRVAVAARDEAEAELATERRDVLRAAAGAFHRAEAARLRLVALDDLALPAAREAADLATLGVKEGRLGVLSVLHAESAYFEARIARSEAWLDWATAHADLLALAGEPAGDP